MEAIFILSQISGLQNLLVFNKWMNFTMMSYWKFRVYLFQQPSPIYTTNANGQDTALLYSPIWRNSSDLLAQFIFFCFSFKFQDANLTFGGF